MNKEFRNRFNRHKYRLTVIVVLIIVSSISCRKIFEKDLSELSITTNMPVNNYSSSSSYLQFWWNEIDGATFYNIQIVKPNFDTIVSLIVDSNLTNNKFEWSFSPGNYSWRIKACNSTSCTPFQTFKFNVDSTLDLSNTKIILISPLDHIYLNNISINFSWLKEYNADHYIFSIYDSLNIPIINHKKIYNHNIQIPGQDINDTLNDGVYKWTVNAKNATSTSQLSSHICTIDRKKPSKPSLLKPTANSQLTSSKITFQWISGKDINFFYDSLLIYKDSNQLTLDRAFRSTSNTLIDSLTSGSYYWHIKTYDKAGNYSNKSEIRKLTIN